MGLGETYVTNYTVFVICTGLKYFGEENVPVFITFLLFYRHNMPILAVNSLVSSLNQLSKSIEVMVQCCKKDSTQENPVSAQ